MSINLEQRKLFGMTNKALNFSDEQVVELFGHEAAEDERPERLREYYFKNDVYEKVKAQLPLRIIVGHKGVGKSAILQVLKQELEDDKKLVVSISPSDIDGIDETSEDMMELIRRWSDGIKDVIVRKTIEKFGENGKTKKAIGNIINSIMEAVDDNYFKFKKNGNDLFLSFDDKKEITVLIDDLDLGWEGKKSDIRRISAMLNAVRALSRNNPSVYFKISLRTDVYYLYRTSDESTDKVESSIVWLSWTTHQLLALLCKRIITYFGGSALESDLIKMPQKEYDKILEYVFCARFNCMGNWSDIPTRHLISSLVRKRPRDLVKLCSSAAKEANKRGETIINSADFKNIFNHYSSERLRDTVIEFRSELPDIEALLLKMKPTTKEKKFADSFLFTYDNLLEKVKHITEQQKFTFANGKTAYPKDLCEFMYKISFITARKDSDAKIVRFEFEEQNYLLNSAVNYGYKREVHPAYRWALSPDNNMAIIKSLPI